MQIVKCAWCHHLIGYRTDGRRHTTITAEICEACEEAVIEACRQHLAEPRRTVVRDVNLIVLGFQSTTNETRYLLLIFNNEDAHPLQ